jgi:hypothetical protein
MTEWYTLALDLATRTGWAVCDGKVIIASGTADFSASLKSPNQQGFKISLLENWFRECQFHNFVNEIVIEDIMVFRGKTSKQSQKAIQSYFHLQGKVYEYARAINCRAPTLINPMTLKKDFTGFGSASKEDMAREAQNRGWQDAQWDKITGKILNGDEADAIALLFVNAESKGQQISF